MAVQLDQVPMHGVQWAPPDRPARLRPLAGFLRGTSPRWLVVAGVVTALSWTAVLAGLGIFLATGELAGPGPYFAMDALVGLSYGGVVLLMLPRSRHPVTWIVAAAALGCAINVFLNPYVPLAVQDPRLPISPVVANLLGWAWMPGTLASMAVLPWLLPGPAPRAARIVAVVALVPITWRVVSVLFGTSVIPDNPLAVMPDAFHDLDRSLGLLPERTIVVISILGAARLAWAWWTAPPDAGRGFGWLSISQVLLAVGFIPVWFPMPALVAGAATDISAATLIAAQPFLLGALLVVVLGQQLWGIDATVNRATVWMFLSAILVASYLLVGWLLQRWVSAPADAAGLVALCALLVLSHPLREWLQERVDHLVYGAATDPGKLLSALRGTGSSDGSPDRLQELLDSLLAALRLGRIEVRAGDGSVIAAAGRGLEVQHVVALPTGGRSDSFLAVAPVTGQTLDARTRLLVDQTAGVIGVFLDLTRAHVQLDAATARLVEVRHEERRMLRRDLHDGIGPALAGVGLGLVAARRRLAHDPDGADRLLQELADEVNRRTEDVRLVARALLPAALDDGDLAGALQILAERFRSSGLDVRLDVGSLGDVETRRQIAVYHVAAEGILNVHRHARATRVHVRVSGTRDEPVTLEIVDDGIGIAQQVGRGVGLASMHERAEELGGTLEVTPVSGGGTSVIMVLP